MISVLNLTIIPPVLCVLCYMCGTVLDAKGERTIGERLIWGFVLIIGVFEIVALPFMYYESSMTKLYIICAILVILAVILYVGMLLKNKPWKCMKKNIFSMRENITKGKIVFWVLIIGLIAFQIFYILYYQHADEDDAYYLAQINTVLETNYLLNVEPSTGIEVFQFSNQNKLVGHEILLAIICKLFNANAAFLCHMVLPVFLIPLHYVVVYYLGKNINEKYKEIFMLLSIAVNFFCAFSGATASAFLSYRVWQGKTILVSILLPMLLLEFVKIYKENMISYKTLFKLMLILWAGFYATTVGLYLLPIAYFVYTVVYFASSKNIKNSFKLCIPVFLSLPFVGAKVLALLSENYFAYDAASKYELSYRDVLFGKYLNGDKMLWIWVVFFVLILIYIWKKGTKIEKMVAVYAPLVLLCTFANPLLISFVSQYVTGEEVYWRLFWLIQLRYIIVIAMIVYLSNEVGKKLVSLLAMILFIAGSGNFIFQDSHFRERSNRYKISDRAVWISDEIIAEGDEENNYLLIPGYYSWEVRQYTGKVRLVWGRYVSGLYSEEDFAKLETLYHQLYESKAWNVDNLEKQLDYFHVNYVYMDKKALRLNKLPDDFELMFEKEEYALYKVN